jgi:Leucine-rich repeat (LRR) protein
MEFTESEYSSYMDYDVLKGIYGEIPENAYNRLELTDIELYENIEEILALPNITAMKISLSDTPYQESIFLKLSSISTLVKLEITSIDFENRTELPQSIYNYENLKILNINNIDITNLSESLGDLADLQELWVHHTALQYLPQSISKLTKLIHLHIEANDIRELPMSLSELKELRTLDLFFNSLISLPSSLHQLPRLWKLDALYNDDLKEIPKALLLSETLIEFRY